MVDGGWVVRRRSRLEPAEQLGAASARLAAGQSQRQVAAELGLARSTFQEWCQPVAVGAAPAALAAWVETAEGVRWLHQPEKLGWREKIPFLLRQAQHERDFFGSPNG